MPNKLIDNQHYKRLRRKTLTAFHSLSYFTLTTTRFNLSFLLNFKLLYNDSETGLLFSPDFHVADPTSPTSGGFNFSFSLFQRWSYPYLASKYEPKFRVHILSITIKLITLKLRYNLLSSKYWYEVWRFIQRKNVNSQSPCPAMQGF